MRRFGTTLLFAALLLTGCSRGLGSGDYDAGFNGGPPEALSEQKVYSNEFVIEQKNYVLAVGNIHSFLIANDFYPRYSHCFYDVLDIRVTANIEKHKQRFPCVALEAEQGVPPKVYLSVTVRDVMFNQLDGNNRLVCVVSMFGRDELAKTFASEVAPALENLGVKASVASHDQH
jgi:hypothetical protein